MIRRAHGILLALLLLAALPCAALGTQGVGDQSGALLAGAAGPAAYYACDGNAVDSSGNGHNGLANGCQATADRFGRRLEALQFNGLDNWIDLPTAEAILGADPDAWSVATWFRTAALDTHMVLISDYNSGGWDTRFGIQIEQYKDGVVHASVRKQHMLQWELTSASSLPLGSWHHLAFTASKTTGMIHLYIDGVLADESPFDTDVDYIEAVPVHIGKSIFQGLDHLPYNGDLDEVRLYDRALSEAEVAWLYGDGNVRRDGRIAVLIRDSGAPAEDDIGFINVCRGLFSFEVIGVNQVASGMIDPATYGVIICNSRGTAAELAVFDQPELALRLRNASEHGTAFVLAGGGAKILSALSLGSTIEGVFSPALNDSWFMVDVNASSAIATGIPTFPDYSNYTRDELDAMDHDGLVWRIDSSSSYAYVTLDNASIEPDFYLGEYVWTGWGISPPTSMVPFWYNNGSPVVYLHNFFWTRDNDTHSGGYIGVAGRALLANTVTVVQQRTVDVPGSNGSTAPRAPLIVAAYPNPFNPVVRIAFDQSREGMVDVTVYDAAGREVRNLCSAFLPAGPGEVTWDGSYQSGQRAASGVYLCRVRAAGAMNVRKITLAK